MATSNVPMEFTITDLRFQDCELGDPALCEVFSINLEDEQRDTFGNEDFGASVGFACAKEGEQETIILDTGWTTLRLSTINYEAVRTWLAKNRNRQPLPANGVQLRSAQS